jgi:hypothetical protein
MPATFLQEKYDMPIEFFDRIPGKLGRVRVTPENGGTPYYAVIERADEPVVAGTPRNAASLNAAQETLAYQDTSGVHTFKRVYIATNGNDANTGATASVPMASLRAAIRKYAKWHKYLDFYLADGTYTEDIGGINTDNCSLSIRSTSENRDAVIINMATTLETLINQFRLYNLTINMTATGTRAITVNGGAFFSHNVAINMPSTSTATCVNVNNGSTAVLSQTVINAGTTAAVYANRALLVRAHNCTSTRKINLAFHAVNAAVIEYTPTMNATTMTKVESAGKCLLADLSGTSISSTEGQHKSGDGTLIQWGLVQIKPTAVNTPASLLVTYPIPFSEAPIVVASPSTVAPQTVSVGVSRVGTQITDNKKHVLLTVSRTSDVSSTGVLWIAIGKG